MRGQQGQRHRNNKCKDECRKPCAVLCLVETLQFCNFEEYGERKVNRELRLMWEAEA